MSASGPVTRPTAGGDRVTDEQSLVDAALGGRQWADAQVCDGHAGALYSLAQLILQRNEPAEVVVVGVVADACTRPGLVSIGARRSLRHELARLTYLRCAEPMAPALPVPMVSAMLLADLRALSLPEQARARP